MKELAQTAVSMLEKQFEAIEQKSVDQELEDAAINAYPYNEVWDYAEERYKMNNTLGYEAFKEGAKWQKEQSATDDIEFMQFRDDNCVKMSERWMTLFAGDGGKLYTIQELYELWQQIKKK